MDEKTDKPEEVVEEPIAEPKQPGADEQAPKKPVVPKLLPEIVEPKTGGFRSRWTRRTVMAEKPEKKTVGGFEFYASLSAPEDSDKSSPTVSGG